MSYIIMAGGVDGAFPSDAPTPQKSYIIICEFVLPTPLEKIVQ